MTCEPNEKLVANMKKRLAGELPTIRAAPINKRYRSVLGFNSNKKSHCWTIAKQPGTHGYLTLNLNKSSEQMHRLSCFIQTNEFYRGKEIQASHRCNNNKLCIRPKHLTWESARLNRSRDCCVLHANVADYKCPHEPPCYKPSQQYKLVRPKLFVLFSPFSFFSLLSHLISRNRHRLV